jgi:hypothetical protein
LDSFKKRHNIVWNGVCGESKDVDENVVSEYKPKLLELISPYELKNMHNADETSLYFRVLPTKSLVVKGGKVYWGGQNVQRKTYSVIVWKYGGRNGKATKPKWFKNLKN